MYAGGGSIAPAMYFFMILIKSTKKLLFCVKSVTSEGFCGIVLLVPALRKSWTDYGHSSPANTDVFLVVPSLHPKSFRVERCDDWKYVCVHRLQSFTKGSTKYDKNVSF